MKHTNPISHLATLAILLILFSLSETNAATPNLLSYQGYLTDASGTPLNGVYQATFSIYSDSVSGLLLWQEIEQLDCKKGLFSVLLGHTTPITSGTFYLSQDAYLGISLDSDPEMLPRRRLVSSPFALRVSALDGSYGGDIFSPVVVHALGYGVIPGVEASGDQYGGKFVAFTSSSNSAGVFGFYAGSKIGLYGAGVRGLSTPGDGSGVGGDFQGGYIGCRGFVQVPSTSTANHFGLIGSVAGVATSGDNFGAYSVAVGGLNNYGIYASATNSGAGSSANAFGIYATADQNDGHGGWAGYFDGWTTCHGTLEVLGTLYKPGGAFRIDHPLDPENKYLEHSFVESPDMKNIYDGIVILDANGEATVQMAKWFEALNKDFRYQLTAIGAPAPGLYISKEVENNQFSIAGGKPGLKVSWTVTGIRHDPYANANRIQVEVDKPAQERGLYVSPESYGLGPEKHIHARIFEQIKKANAEMAMKKTQEEEKK